MPGKQLTREISRCARNDTYLVNKALKYGFTITSAFTIQVSVRNLDLYPVESLQPYLVLCKQCSSTFRMPKAPN